MLNFGSNYVIQWLHFGTTTIPYSYCVMIGLLFKINTLSLCTLCSFTFRMIQENIINIDIVNEDVVNFSKFLQQEFSSEINVTDIFGIKFEANEPVKINIVKPLNVAKEEDSEELYTCKYCNKSFSRVYHLNRQ